MKPSIYFLFTALTVGLLIHSCNKENTNIKANNFKGQLMSKSECKSNLKSTSKIVEISDTLSCIDYSFDVSSNKLIINHVNAGFNCCQDRIYCNVSLSNDTIIIQEIELNPECNCNCLFDLNIEIEGIDIKSYQIKFIEPYVGAQNKISFGIDLTKDKVGSFCVDRRQYPWSQSSIIK